MKTICFQRESVDRDGTPRKKQSTVFLLDVFLLDQRGTIWEWTQDQASRSNVWFSIFSSPGPAGFCFSAHWCYSWTCLDWRLMTVLYWLNLCGLKNNGKYSGQAFSLVSNFSQWPLVVLQPFHWLSCIQDVVLLIYWWLNIVVKPQKTW